jgi:N utilization substance protein B
MLSRRSLRIKVMQVLYAANHSESDPLKVVLQQIDSAYKLPGMYLQQLIALQSAGDKEVEIKRSKFLPTEEDLMASNVLAGNQFLQQLTASEDLKRKIAAAQAHLRINPETTWAVYREMKEHAAFKKYQAAANQGYEADRDFAVVLLKKIIANNELFVQQLEEEFMNASDDSVPVMLVLAEGISKLAQQSNPAALLDFPDQAEEKEFAASLISIYQENKIALQEMIAPRLVNWDLDRVAEIDLILMKLALCEILHFPSIPVKVSLNEYIEISKIYSTPKSWEFINGILDSILKSLKQEGRIKKAGRGLVE